MILKEWIFIHKHEIDYNEIYYLLKNLFETDFVDESIELSFFVKKSLDICLNLRINGIPLAKILHKKWFYEDCFITDFDTLDPRPETEFLIEKIIGTPRSILELGVGTGCLLLSIVKKFYKANGIGIDISLKALNIAKKNVDLLNLNKKIKLLHGNWGYNLKGYFDLIVCNPPYILKNDKLSKETLNDPAIALYGSSQTYWDIKNSLINITFKQIIFEVPDYLVEDIVVIFKEFKVDIFQIYDTSIYVISIYNH